MSPQGSKSSYTSKQRRQARHIEDSVKRRGGSQRKAERIAYATVNKQDGGGKKSGSGRGRKRDTSPSNRGGRKGGKATSSRTSKRAGRSTRTRSRSRSSGSRMTRKQAAAKGGRASARSRSSNRSRRSSRSR